MNFVALICESDPSQFCATWLSSWLKVSNGEINMYGGLKKSASRLALVAAAGVLSTNAFAADLGGDCCADLEERVAELEATTARKGNRKMNLTVTGQVTRNIMYFNDGLFSRTFAGLENRVEQTKFYFTGSS